MLAKTNMKLVRFESTTGLVFGIYDVIGQRKLAAQFDGLSDRQPQNCHQLVKKNVTEEECWLSCLLFRSLW